MNSINAFNSFRTNIEIYTEQTGAGLVSTGLQGGRITFGDIGVKRSVPKPIVDFEMSDCSGGCSCAKSKAGTKSLKGSLLRGVFGRRLGDFLPDRDPRKAFDRAMLGDIARQGRHWEHIRGMTVADAVRTIYNAESINWVELRENGTSPINVSGFEYLQGLLAERANEAEGLDAADALLASAAVMWGVSNRSVGVHHKLTNTLERAAQANAAGGEPASAAALYELAQCFAPVEYGYDIRQLKAPARKLWGEVLENISQDDPLYLEVLYRLMNYAWDDYDTSDWDPRALLWLHSRHASYSLNRRELDDAASSMIRDAWARAEILVKEGPDALGVEKVLVLINGAMMNYQMSENEGAKERAMGAKELYLKGEEILKSL